MFEAAGQLVAFALQIDHLGGGQRGAGLHYFEFGTRIAKFHADTRQFLGTRIDIGKQRFLADCRCLDFSPQGFDLRLALCDPLAQRIDLRFTGLRGIQKLFALDPALVDEPLRNTQFFELCLYLLVGFRSNFRRLVRARKCRRT